MTCKCLQSQLPCTELWCCCCKRDWTYLKYLISAFSLLWIWCVQFNYFQLFLLVFNKSSLYFISLEFDWSVNYWSIDFCFNNELLVALLNTLLQPILWIQGVLLYISGLYLDIVQHFQLKYTGLNFIPSWGS